MKVLQTVRKVKNMTVGELAEQVGVSDKYIYMLEQGKKAPSLDMAHKIARALGVKIEEIFYPEGATHVDGRTRHAK
ncbi:MAG: putative HTH-type transcriptional regulator [Firmicutes bacterium]|nr:putative HTH-type transcriptional regulator [Bacillota bacterium]